MASSRISSSTTPSTPVKTASPASTAGACGPSQVKVALASIVVGLGNVGGFLSFTNVSGATCQLAGWPNLVGIEPDGAVSVARHLLRTAFGPEDLTRAPVVVLKPGTSALAALHGTDLAVGSSDRCPPAFRPLPGHSARHDTRGSDVGMAR